MIITTTRMMGLYCLGIVLSVIALVQEVKANYVNCLMEADGRGKMKECFRDQGIDIAIPHLDKESGMEESRKLYLDALLVPDEMCKHPAKFKRAIVCAVNRSRDCMPPERRGYIPTDSSMVKVVDTTCSRDDIDFKCVNDKTKELFDCSVRKAQEKITEDMSFEELLCIAYQLTAICQKEVLPACGCMTTKIFSDLSVDLLYPPACPTVEPPPQRVVCNVTNSRLFLYDGLGNASHRLSQPSWWSLLSIASLACSMTSSFFVLSLKL